MTNKKVDRQKQNKQTLYRKEGAEMGQKGAVDFSALKRFVCFNGQSTEIPFAISISRANVLRFLHLKSD